MSSGIHPSEIHAQLDQMLSEIESQSFILGDLKELIVPIRNTFKNLRSDLMKIHEGGELPPLSSVLAPFEKAMFWINKLRLGSKTAKTELRNTSTEDAIYSLLVEFSSVCMVPDKVFYALWSREGSFETETLRPQKANTEGYLRKGDELRALRTWLEEKANGHWGKDLGSAVMKVILDRFEEEHLNDRSDTRS